MARLRPTFTDVSIIQAVQASAPDEDITLNVLLDRRGRFQARAPAWLHACCTPHPGRKHQRMLGHQHAHARCCALHACDTSFMTLLKKHTGFTAVHC